MDKVPVVEIDPLTPILDVLSFMAYTQASIFTAVQKSRFISGAVGFGVSRKDVELTLLPLFHLDPHVLIVKKCLDLAKLPEQVLAFCHEKQFSLKQCGFLTAYPEALLNGVLELSLHLTASTFLEILENLNDHLKKERLLFLDWLNRTEVQAILLESETPQSRTSRLREYLYGLRHPLLIGINQSLEKKTQVLQSSGVTVSWDKTLENRGVTVNVSASSTKDLIEKLTKASEENAMMIFQDILDAGQ
jgi:hypothetical protein